MNKKKLHHNYEEYENYRDKKKINNKLKLLFI
jgi:hypothetical protein